MELGTADAKFAEDLARAVGEEKARDALPAPEPDPARDMNDWKGVTGHDG